jgi:hypothetical protein
MALTLPDIQIPHHTSHISCPRRLAHHDAGSFYQNRNGHCWRVQASPPQGWIGKGAQEYLNIKLSNTIIADINPYGSSDRHSIYSILDKSKNNGA